MTRKIHILFLFVSLGFFLMSGTSYACGKSSEKMACEKKAGSSDNSSESCQKDCCKKEGAAKNDEHGCNRKCDHSGCTTAGLQFSWMTTNEFDFQSNLFNFSVEKTTPYYKNISISDGFTAIWLPPKIK